MVIFAALFILLFITVLFGHVFLPRIKDFLQEDVLHMLLWQFSANQNVNRRIRGNMEAGEGVEPLTPSPSSPRAGGSEFDVFLSFRGEDNRKGFTGHLHDGLQERGITTFLDCEKLEKGEKIHKLLEYIERSKIFVPIFSKRFAESKWCLKEVTKIVECRKEIIPVFFGVEHVRNQTGPFKSAFKDHQSNKKHDQEEVRKWREALKNVGNLSRIQGHEWVTGTIDAEGIQILQKDEPFNENDCVSAECFENMPNLRYLLADNVKFQGTFPCFPTDLKWLQLESCHFDSLPSDFNLEELVILDLYKTNMAPILINQLSLKLKAFERLKVLSLCRVETKITLNFTNLPSLVKLQFLDCSALTTIDESIGKLKNLTHLSTPDCRFLLKLPDSIWRLSSLEVLNIYGCFKISSLPEQLGELGSLKKLDVSFTDIKEVPDSICRLSSLEILILRCTALCSIPEGLGDMEALKKIDVCHTLIEVVPDSICQLKLLKSLNLRECPLLCSLPERLGDMEKLEELILDNTRIEIIPDSVGQLKSLRLLSLEGCKLLKALPISISQLSSIQQLNMSGTSLTSSENNLPHLAAIEFTGSSSELLGLCDQTHKALEILHMKDAIIEELPDCIGRMENLKELRLECEMLKELPNRIEGSLENLTQLEVRSMHLKALADSIGSLKQLLMLSLMCENLEALPDSIGELENVVFFKIESAKLKALPDCIGSLKRMWTLELNCVNLKALPNSIGRLEELKEFEVWSNSVEALPDSIGLLKHINKLELQCPNLEILPDSIGELESLVYFEVDSHRLKYLPNSIVSLTRIWA